MESGSSPLALAAQPTAVPPVYRFLQTAAPSVIVEFPVSVYDPTYMFWSTYHWHSLVNGYSGYTPWDASTRCADADVSRRESVERLKALNVRYVLVHQAFYPPDDYDEPDGGDRGTARVVPGGRYRDWVGDTQIFER